MSESIPVNVQILDKEYMISCPVEDKEALLQSAKVLNERMREVRDGGKVLGTERIAVMAALNIVHELLRHQNHHAAAVAAVQNDVGRLEQKIIGAISRRRVPEAVD
jgi:cell division protein ZapA